MTRILYRQLLTTFQGAVTFTRWLGTRCLWIDALCIVQDNKADWQRESLAMARIHPGSYLTLSAAKAASGAGGLFTHQDRALLERQLQFGQEHMLDNGQLSLRMSTPHQIIKPDNKTTYSQSYERSQFPILSRAWVFQEKLLASRLLHFGECELYWECDIKTRCECDQAKYWVTDKETFIMMLLPGLDLDTYMQTWKRLLTRYIHRHLTLATDRLIAMSGVAKLVDSVLGPLDGRYVAGLWSIDRCALL